ncbi:NnrS family protein, partial [Proteus mirabilis]|uniref:NnrS family protein n=1 Tax=Proteus mirabilis TaxID=584 RepID=UPI0019533823
MSTSTAATLRAYRGPALFSFGFRPFFLFAALWSAAAVPLWIVVLSFNGGMLGDQDG